MSLSPLEMHVLGGWQTWWLLQIQQQKYFCNRSTLYSEEKEVVGLRHEVKKKVANFLLVLLVCFYSPSFQALGNEVAMRGALKRLLSKPGWPEAEMLMDRCLSLLSI